MLFVVSGSCYGASQNLRDTLSAQERETLRQEEIDVQQANGDYVFAVRNRINRNNPNTYACYQAIMSCTSLPEIIANLAASYTTLPAEETDAYRLIFKQTVFASVLSRIHPDEADFLTLNHKPQQLYIDWAHGERPAEPQNGNCTIM